MTKSELPHMGSWCRGSYMSTRARRVADEAFSQTDGNRPRHRSPIEDELAGAHRHTREPHAHRPLSRSPIGQTAKRGCWMESKRLIAVAIALQQASIDSVPWIIAGWHPPGE